LVDCVTWWTAELTAVAGHDLVGSWALGGERHSHALVTAGASSYVTAVAAERMTCIAV
jgi:hypothetical protein